MAGIEIGDMVKPSNNIEISTAHRFVKAYLAH